MKFKKIISTICAFSMVVSSVFCCKAENSEIKLAFFGDANVGKSQIVSQWLRNGFKEDHVTTTGGCCFVKDILSAVSSLRINIWDIPGEKRYQSLLPLLFRNSDIGVCVVDLNDVESLDIKERVKQFRANAEDAEIMLVGNKSDLINGDKQIAFQKLKGIALENSIREENVILFSAKEGKGIQKLETKILNINSGLQEIKKIKNKKLEKEKTKKLVKDGACAAGIGGSILAALHLYNKIFGSNNSKIKQVK